MIEFEDEIITRKKKFIRDLKQLEIKCESYHKNIPMSEFINKQDVWNNFLIEEEIIFKDIESLQNKINETSLFLT